MTDARRSALPTSGPPQQLWDLCLAGFCDTADSFHRPPRPGSEPAYFFVDRSFQDYYSRTCPDLVTDVSARAVAFEPPPGLSARYYGPFVAACWRGERNTERVNIYESMAQPHMRRAYAKGFCMWVLDDGTRLCFEGSLLYMR